jgi:hypothetical protein
MVHLYDVAPTMTNSSVCVRVCVCVCIDAKRILCPARGTIAGSKPSASLEDLVSSSSGRLSPRSIDSFAAGSISTSVAGTDRRHSSGARHNIGDGARNRSHGSGDGRRRSRWGDGRGKSGDNDNNGVAVVVDAAPAARHGNGGGGDNTGSRHNSGARHNLGRGARHRSRSGDIRVSCQCQQQQVPQRYGGKLDTQQWCLARLQSQQSLCRRGRQRRVSERSRHSRKPAMRGLI